MSPPIIVDAEWRGQYSEGRAQVMSGIAPEFDASFPWLKPPILNPFTRLAMVADPKEERLIARGYETSGAATDTLDVTWSKEHRKKEPS